MYCFSGKYRTPLTASALATFLLLFLTGYAPAADNTYVRFNTVFGPIDVQMLSDEAPNTVANFLGYVNTKAYNGTIIHRSVTFPEAFFQGGTFYDNVHLTTVKTVAPIDNEFSVSNTRGTLSTTLNGSDYNSATSGWFFNDQDNSASFDPGKYTVFGMIANSGSLAVMDAIQAIPGYDASGIGPAFANLPLIGYVSGSIQLSNLVEVNSIVTEPAPADATISLSDLAVSANGVAHAPVVTTSPPNLTALVTYNGILGAPTATGTYTLFAAITSPGYAGSTTGTLVVSAQNASPATATIALGNLAATFDGNPHPVSANPTPSGLNVDVLYNGSNVVPIAAGKYTVVATIDDPNYKGSSTGTLVISKGAATITSVSGVSTTYDGNPHYATATTTPAGVNVDFTYNNSATVPVQVGTYKVIAKISDPSFIGASSGTGTVTISPVNSATVTVPPVTLPYNGKPQPAIAQTNPPFMAVKFLYDGSTKAPTAVGTYTVTATVDSPDLVGTASGTGTETISTGTATVTLNAKTLSVLYNGKPHAVTATTVPAGLDVTFTYNGSSTPPTAIGAYPIVATVNSPNYTGSATGTLNITAAATTDAATLITATGATLNGTVNPDGTDTGVTFEYGTSTAYGTTTTSQDEGAGTSTVPASAAVTGLSPKTVYHYRIDATSNGALGVGLDKTFTTLAAPAFAGSPSTPLLSASGAQVGFGVNPNGIATTVYFRYSTDQNFGSFSQTATQSIGAGKTQVVVTGFLSQLQASTTYYYEVVTVSAAGTFDGPEESFTTLAFDTSVVVKTGAPASGTGGGSYALFGDVAINDSDGVTFAASLSLSTANPVINSANSLGIWANQGTSALALIAQTGGTAPDTASATFNTFGDPVYNENNGVAFGGQLNVVTGQATSATDLGAWSTSSGALRLIARQGDPAPGYNGTTLTTFGTLDAVALSDANTLVIANLALGTGVTASNDFGIWEGTLESNLALKMRTGDVVGSKTISAVTLTSSESLLEGVTRDFASNTGDLAALATFSDGTSGIVTSENGVEALAETVSSPVPDANGNTISGAAFASFRSPIINDSDHLAFEATLSLSGTITSANDAGIWADTSGGTLELVAQTGQTGTEFLTLSDPLDNNNDATAFSATFKSGTKTVTGLFCNSTGAVTPVAQTGGQAPGCPTGVTFSAFTVMALADAGGATNNGGVVFEATVAGSGVTTANNTGIWAVDNTGTLQLIVRTGDSLNVATSGTPIFKTISDLAFLPYSSVLDGQTRGVAKNEDLAYTVTFKDDTAAIFNVVFPPPGP